MLGILKGSKRRKRRDRSDKNNKINNITSNIINFQTLKTPEKVRLENEIKFKVNKIERNTIKHFNKNINNRVKVNFQQLVEALPKVIQSGQICKDRKQRRREIFRKTRGKGLKVKKSNWNLYSYVRCL